MKNYADRLANFLEWCDVRALEPMTAEYTRDLIGRYQTEMLKGIWSRDNTSLAERTINARVDVAAEYLTWAADKGFRAQFVIPKITHTYVTGSATSSVSHLPKQVEVRRGKLRENKRRLGFPVEQEINAWLSRIYAKEPSGPTEGLICETILETAIRREEAACLRVDTLPRDRAEWRVQNPAAAPEHQAVLVELKYGTKGREHGRDHGDKIGPTGEILMPIPLALKLHYYRETVRPRALMVAIQQGRTRAEQQKIRGDSVQLFLNPLTGQRYTGNSIYEIWRSVERPRGWSPHLARDFWACSLLWQRLEAHRDLLEEARRTKVEETLLQSLKMDALSVIQLEIQPQLRHRSPETTLIYLQWLADRLHVNLNLHQRWVEEISDDGEGVCE